MGLHIVLRAIGVMRIEYARVEKCGQRGVMGKYCLHFHLAQQCPDCVLRGNAIEHGMQRGIVVHGTHLALIEDNVIYDVRGSAIYIEVLSALI
jgi:hypothetical protein